MTTLAQNFMGLEEVVQKVENVTSYITTALQILNKDKYKHVIVATDPVAITQAIIIAQKPNLSYEEYRIENVLEFEAEAQAYYETLWEKNPEYPDQPYLACIAYETTLRKYFKEAVDGEQFTHVITES